MTSALLPEQVEALRAVDLRLAFGNHGYEGKTEQGPAILAVTDAEYALAADFVADLQGTRGDQLAIEGAGYTSPNVLAGLLTVRASELRSSKFTTAAEDTTLRRLQQTVDAGDARAAFSAPELVPIWDQYRRWQLINPVDYAIGLAAARGAACTYAAANITELSDFYKDQERRYARVLKLPVLFLLPLVIRMEKEEERFRDRKTVQKLGMLACGMEPSGERTPILAYMGGLYHRRPVERLLTAHGIGFTTTNFYPGRQSRIIRDKLRDYGSLLLPNVASSEEHYEALWLANARRQSAQAAE